MDLQVGVVTGSKVETNRDSEDKSIMLQCEISQLGDVQTVELYSQAGEDYVPPDDSTVTILAAGKAWKIAIASDDGIESIVEKGERLLYSSDTGTKMATIHLKKSGVIELNGSEDFAVAFGELKVGFDDLVSSVVAELTEIAAAIGGVGGSYTPGSITSSIDDSKIESIKVPETPEVPQ